MNVNIKVVPGGMVPTYGKDGDAGLDLYARAQGFIRPGDSHKIPVGFMIAIPGGHVGIIMPRSGLSWADGIAIMGGVIDSNYRGEVHAILHVAASNRQFLYSFGDRVAQMIIVPCVRAELEAVADLDATVRGTAGFGSSGR